MTLRGGIISRRRGLEVALTPFLVCVYIIYKLNPLINMGYYGGDSSGRDYYSSSAFLSGVDTISCVSLYNILFKPPDKRGVMAVTLRGGIFIRCRRL